MTRRDFFGKLASLCALPLLGVRGILDEPKLTKADIKEAKASGSVVVHEAGPEVYYEWGVWEVPPGREIWMYPAHSDRGKA